MELSPNAAFFTSVTLFGNTIAERLLPKNALTPMVSISLCNSISDNKLLAKALSEIFFTL